MARDTRLSVAVVNAQADALAKLADGGFIEIYDGERPASVDEPVTKQTLGASLRLGSPAFLPAKDGVLTANPIGSAVAVADIKQTWARVLSKDRKPLIDISVGTKDATAIFPASMIVKGTTVTCSSFQHTVPRVAK